MAPKGKWMFVSDVDETLLGNQEMLHHLTIKLKRDGGTLVTVYNSDRSCASLRKLLNSVNLLPEPDYLVGAMGMEIQEGVSGKPLYDYMRQYSDSWQREKITALLEAVDLKALPDHYQTPFKISYEMPDDDTCQQIRKRLREAALEAKIISREEGRVDIIPAGAGKAAAVEYLRKALKIPPGRVVIAGTSGGDANMFRHSYKGIVVDNAEPSLKEINGDNIYHAESKYAGGVLEGLEYWEVL